MFRDLFLAAFVFLLLCLSAWAGRALYRVLAETHRTQGPLEFVRVVSGLLVTFTALILGLLLTQVGGDYRKTDTDLRTYASQLITLDAELGELGRQSSPARQLVRQYTAASIASLWPEEKPPAGVYPEGRSDGDGVETPNLGDLLLAAETNIRRLKPKDGEADKLQAACLARMSALLDRRWDLINEAEVSISAPFFAMMVVWLMVVFASFGLTAPKGPLTVACIGMIALSIAGAVFTIVELDGPLDGIIKVSSQPLRHALLHMDAAEPMQGGLANTR